MEKTTQLYRALGENGRCYDFSSDAIAWDYTWRMQVGPYPPEPSYEFILEEEGEIIQILEIWEGYVEALFHYVKKADLLGNNFGEVWFEFCWIGNTDDDWLLNQEDLNDFISMLKATPLYEISDKEIEAQQISLPEVQKLEELRDYLVDYFSPIATSKYSVYFRKN